MANLFFMNAQIILTLAIEIKIYAVKISKDFLFQQRISHFCSNIMVQYIHK